VSSFSKLQICIQINKNTNVASPLWPSVGVKPNTCKVGDLESFGTPECSELDSKAQTTSHWGVIGIIGKVLKRRYRKWPRIGHLDIYSPSYGQKKGRESNWQFDSRPLKVGNRPLLDIRFESTTWCWKDLDDYNFGLDLVAIGLYSRELWPSKVSELQPGQFRDSISGVPRIYAIWMQAPRRGAENTVWGKVVASPEFGLWWVLCVKVPVACPNTQGCPKC
jgi:hypothetical protein